MQWSKLFCIGILVAFVWSNSHADDLSASDQWDHVAADTENAFRKHADAQNRSWEEMRRRVLQKWSDGALPERKIYVEYSDHDTTRIKIDYENGSVTVEALIDAADHTTPSTQAKNKIEKALSAAISHETKSIDAVLSADEVSATDRRDLISTLTQNIEPSGIEKGEDDQNRKLYRLTFKLVPDYIKRRAAKVRPIVDIWAKKYHIDPAFMLAIIRQESSFNPRARSSVGAVGLMQIMPQFAGKEVLQAVTGKSAQPTPEFLYDPQKNIMIGATYLQLLRDQYFAGVKDDEKRLYLITCSYNWGPHRIKNAIERGSLSTRAPASEIYRTLQKIAPAETSEYLRKVTQYTADFKGKD